MKHYPKDPDTIERENERAGLHFFSPETMRFFSSRWCCDPVADAYGNTYFGTSQKSGFTDTTRQYLLHRQNRDASIDKVATFTTRYALSAALKDLDGAKVIPETSTDRYREDYVLARTRFGPAKATKRSAETENRFKKTQEATR